MSLGVMMSLDNISTFAWQVPVAGFCLQPTCIPSSDPDWKNVIPIETHGAGGFIDRFEEKHFTSQKNMLHIKVSTCPPN